MADNHYLFDRNKPAGFRLGRAHEDLDNALARLVNERDAMTQMLDGDGSQDGHYAAHVTAYGFGDTADAHAAYSELSAAIGKLTTDASVSSVNAALKQFVARFRN